MVNVEHAAESLKNAQAVNPILVPYVQAGALSGVAGLLIGSIYGTYKRPRPGIFAAALGIECFLVGSFFWINRSGLCEAWQIEPSSPSSDFVTASATAGGLTGGVAGAVLRGRHRIIPGVLLFTLAGYAGQKGYNYMDARNTRQIQSAAADNSTKRKTIWQRVVDSKYSPMTRYSDKEYEDLLREKMVRIEAEIALVDEDIEEIQSKTSKDSSKPDSD